MCAELDPLTVAYRACRDRLTEAGLLIPLGVPGLYGLSGRFEDIIERFERYVTRRGAHLQAEVMRFPAIFSRAHYLRTTHIETFPNLMGSVHSFAGNERDHVGLLQKRADGFAHDFEVLRPIAKKNTQVKLVGEIYQLGYRAVGIRKGESEWVAYVNAAIKKAHGDGLIAQWIKQHVDPDLQQSVIDSWDLSKAPKG